MKLWTSEQTARYMVIGLALLGVLMNGFGVLICTASWGDEKYAPVGAAYAVINSMFLVQAAGLGAFLRLRGRRGVRVLRACCVASAIVAVAAGLVSRDSFGALAWLVAPMPVATAPLAHVLAVRRIERGDDSPLMPGAEHMASTTWKEALVIFLVCLMLAFAVSAVFGEGETGSHANRGSDAASHPPVNYESPSFIGEPKE